MNQKTTRKPFVAPQLREEASLAGVTLITGAQGPPSYRLRGYRRHGRRHGGHSGRHGRSS